MDSVLTLLKQEINATMEAEHDLAKWKLGVTAALGAAAFGLSKDTSSNYWLLLLVPFVCAYVDLYSYQYELRIRVIARFLRGHSDTGIELLQQYEKDCENWRKQTVFSLGNWAGFGCSIGASACGPMFYIARHWHDTDLLGVSHEAAGAIWLLGVFLIIGLWLFSQQELGKVGDESGGSKAAPAAPKPGARPHA